MGLAQSLDRVIGLLDGDQWMAYNPYTKVVLGMSRCLNINFNELAMAWHKNTRRNPKVSAGIFMGAPRFLGQRWEW